jgi:hypothetical protein
MTFQRPNKVWFVHEGSRNPDYPDIPGTYLPFDSTILDRAWNSARNYATLSDREFKDMMIQDMIEAQRQERDRRRALLHDEWEQREKDFQPYAQKMIDRISDTEMSEYLRSAGQRPRETKPMVYVNGDYPRGDK